MKINVVACLIVGLVQPLVGLAENNMRDALENLQKAKENLQQATADKGGHRLNALKLINQAINEIQTGIKYDREHISKGERKEDNSLNKIFRERVNQ